MIEEAGESFYFDKVLSNLLQKRHKVQKDVFDSIEILPFKSVENIDLTSLLNVFEHASINDNYFSRMIEINKIINHLQSQNSEYEMSTFIRLGTHIEVENFYLLASSGDKIYLFTHDENILSFLSVVKELLVTRSLNTIYINHLKKCFKMTNNEFYRFFSGFWCSHEVSKL